MIHTFIQEAQIRLFRTGIHRNEIPQASLLLRPMLYPVPEEWKSLEEETSGLSLTLGHLSVYSIWCMTRKKQASTREGQVQGKEVADLSAKTGKRSIASGGLSSRVVLANLLQFRLVVEISL